MHTSARIRLVALISFVLPVLEDGSCRFTVAEAHAAVRQMLGWGIQQQHVRGALTARTPLEWFGITWVQQDGPATQDQEVRWTWDPDNETLQHLTYDAGEAPTP